ncbi:hypothetical protein LTR56_020689 [Elasticomyces elasticus]|nr:hypothetical protein LTR56_020689 [Elasticomyces elasticus]KAK4901461.1 hypothetical protein LTR49_027240 [Elasticomyces elasticus]
MLCQDQPFGEAEAISNKVDLDTALQESNNEGKPYNPAYDRRDMRRLGRIQEVKRRFRFFSLVGYMVILASTWEFALVTSVFTLSNGGTAGRIWCCGMFLSCLSMAEMPTVSSATSGATKLFAPPGYQKPLSYAVGWLCALGWQSAMPLISYTAAQQIIALIATCQADFVWQGWQAALLTIAFVSVWFGFFAFVVIFWVLGPREPASRVFTEFQDQNGWGSYGLAVSTQPTGSLAELTWRQTLVAVVGPSAALIGADEAVHLAEELKDASYILPRAMVSSALMNYATALTMIISFVSAIDPAVLDDVLAMSTGGLSNST